MLEKEAVRETLGNIGGPEVGAADPAEMRAVVGVISRGMRDNPTHVAALGGDPVLREKRVRRIFAQVLPAMGHSLIVARRPDGTVAGVLGMAAPGRCQPGARQRVRLTLGLLPLGPRALSRSLRWVGAWEKRDPEERHWHLGPVAVDAHLQGTGIGSKLMRVFCAQMDAANEDAYLETDKPENVRFYERFGFEVVGEEEVIGVPNWYMARRPRARSGRK
jgi:ribosomal protein S18 acetylase RimI-like enzyme